MDLTSAGRAGEDTSSRERVFEGDDGWLLGPGLSVVKSMMDWVRVETNVRGRRPIELEPAPLPWEEAWSMEDTAGSVRVLRSMRLARPVVLVGEVVVVRFFRDLEMISSPDTFVLNIELVVLVRSVCVDKVAAGSFCVVFEEVVRTAVVLYADKIQ